jgi:hypothetical protein
MTTHEQGQEKRSKSDWLLFVVGFVLASALGFWLTPAILYAQKPQPFQFSHKLHLGEVGDEACKACHAFRKDGSFAGIPTVEKCKECHSEDTLGSTPEEKVFVEQYIKKGKEVPWLVYAKQPACVFFSHAAHAENAGLECAKCHGDHGKTEKLRTYEYNRLTTYSRDIWGKSLLGMGNPPERMKMDSCDDCHKDNGVRDACFVCHK